MISGPRILPGWFWLSTFGLVSSNCSYNYSFSLASMGFAPCELLATKIKTNVKPSPHTQPLCPISSFSFQAFSNGFRLCETEVLYLATEKVPPQNLLQLVRKPARVCSGTRTVFLLLAYTTALALALLTPIRPGDSNNDNNSLCHRAAAQCSGRLWQFPSQARSAKYQCRRKENPQRVKIPAARSKNL